MVKNINELKIKTRKHGEITLGELFKEDLDYTCWAIKNYNLNKKTIFEHYMIIKDFQKYNELLKLKENEELANKQMYIHKLKYAERLLRLNKITQEEFDEIKAIHDKFNKLEGKDDFEKYQILRDSIDDIKRYYKDLASNDLEKLITSYM